MYYLHKQLHCSYQIIFPHMTHIKGLYMLPGNVCNLRCVIKIKVKLQLLNIIYYSAIDYGAIEYQRTSST